MCWRWTCTLALQPAKKFPAWAGKFTLESITINSEFMTQLFFYIVPVAVILGFMIFIHELGHFVVAKALGVRVEQFAIGFGKRLIGFRKGETDYRINAIPLGGYVKMSGENPADEHTGDPREFMSHSRWHRFLIAIAGPSMNILKRCQRECDMNSRGSPV